MKKLSKKSKAFAFGLAFVLLIALSRIYLLVSTRTKEMHGEFTIGTNQINIFDAIQQAEKAILYGEEGFSLAFQQSLHQVASSGGYSAVPICGKSGDYIIWEKDDGTECYPDIEQVKQSLAESTTNLMDNIYLISNPYSKEGYISNHELFFEQKGSKLVARAYALAPAMQEIACHYAIPPGELGGCGKYYYKPSFRKEIKFDINDFKEIVQHAKEISKIMEGCGVLAELFSSCANTAVAEIDKKSEFKWELCEKPGLISDYFAVCADTGNKAFFYDEKAKKMEIKPVVVKFALPFPKIA